MTFELTEQEPDFTTDRGKYAPIRKALRESACGVWIKIHPLTLTEVSGVRGIKYHLQKYEHMQIELTVQQTEQDSEGASLYTAFIRKVSENGKQS